MERRTSCSSRSTSLRALRALVPPPRVHQTRYHDVFAPGSALRAAVTPSGRGDGASAKPWAEEDGAPKAVRMTWMQRLRRVFAIEIETCQRCGGYARGHFEH
jgi:hypothetical protein